MKILILFIALAFFSEPHLALAAGNKTFQCAGRNIGFGLRQTPFARDKCGTDYSVSELIVNCYAEALPARPVGPDDKKPPKPSARPIIFSGKVTAMTGLPCNFEPTKAPAPVPVQATSLATQAEDFLRSLVILTNDVALRAKDSTQQANDFYVNEVHRQEFAQNMRNIQNYIPILTAVKTNNWAVTITTREPFPPNPLLPKAPITDPMDIITNIFVE